MAFTEISRQSGTIVRVSATTAGNNHTLTAAPTSGQWIVVALYTNQGVIDGSGLGGANSTVNSVKCGSISLSLLESGLSILSSPTVYIAPYQSGMTTTVTVNWTNTVAATTMGYATMVFTGAVAGASTGYAQFRTDGANGAFDGSGNDAGGFGFTGALSSAGVITWSSSSAGIPTNYDTQGEVFIAASISSVGTSINQAKQTTGAFSFPSTVDSSGNLTTYSNTTGTVVMLNTTSVATSGKGVAYTPSGNFVFTYTGTTSNSLTGCTTTAPAGTVVPPLCQIMLPGTTTGSGTVTALLPTTSATSGTLGGFQTGNSTAYSGTSTANGHIQTAIAGGTTPCRLELMLGSNISGKTKVPAYVNMRISGSNASNGGGFIYTMVPTTRTMTRVSSASQTMTAKALKTYAWGRLAIASFIRSPRAVKTYTFKRSSIATHVRTASAFKSFTFKRSAKATMNYAITSSNSKTFVRRAIATTVSLAQKLVDIFVKPHPGTVSSDFKTASVTGKSQTASVVGDFKTASVSTKVQFLVKD